jgi:hypothetical protein
LKLVLIKSGEVRPKTGSRVFNKNFYLAGKPPCKRSGGIEQFSFIGILAVVGGSGVSH